MTTPFVPTHRLLNDIPELRLSAGTLLRQCTPFAGGRRDDHLIMKAEEDYLHHQPPWILLPDDVEALPAWETERQKMVERITQRSNQ